MRVARLQIKNFGNPPNLDVALGRNSVVVGENKSGKSSLVRALRLVLDPTLSATERRLTAAARHRHGSTVSLPAAPRVKSAVVRAGTARFARVDSVARVDGGRR
ncbi:AAA family ATPase [Leifsonia sp. NPDC058230]|uniref:AAA family ATPase n=1 Tax=Leifsonia sp. NPDC058230 TaxID=3346391 RepID=UPI0036DB7622